MVETTNVIALKCNNLLCDVEMSKEVVSNSHRFFANLSGCIPLPQILTCTGVGGVETGSMYVQYVQGI